MIERPTSCRLAIDTRRGRALYVPGSLLTGAPQYTLAGRILSEQAVLALCGRWHPRGRTVPVWTHSARALMNPARCAAARSPCGATRPRSRYRSNSGCRDGPNCQAWQNWRVGMVEAPRHLIRAPGGFVRVLRLVIADGHCYPLRYRAYPGPGLCRVCGCVSRYACPGGCCWVDATKTLCSACAEGVTRCQIKLIG